MCQNHEVAILQPQIEKSTEIGSLYTVKILLVYPAPPVSTVFWIFFTPLGLTTTTPPHLSQLYPLHLSLLYPLPPPTSHRWGASFHLDITLTRRILLLFPVITPLAALDLLPQYLLPPGVSRRVPVVSVSFVCLLVLFWPRPDPRSLSDPIWSPLPGFCTRIYLTKHLPVPLHFLVLEKKVFLPSFSFFGFTRSRFIYFLSNSLIWITSTKCYILTQDFIKSWLFAAQCYNTS